MFGEDNHGAETRSDFPNETRILCEPFDIAFIAAVEKDRGRPIGPMDGVDEISLLEGGFVGEAEVVQLLREVPGLVRVGFSHGLGSSVISEKTMGRPGEVGSVSGRSDSESDY